MIKHINDKRIRKILTPPRHDADGWKEAVERFQENDVSLTRRSASEAAVKAVQRMLFFLGYSTTASGGFSIDGDFGRGTNRAVAQFQFEHQLSRKINRNMLCYPCNWQSAAKKITVSPETRLTMATLNAMTTTAIAAIDNKDVMCGNFNVAIRYLNEAHNHRLMNCQKILDRYGKQTAKAVDLIKEETGVLIQHEWILAIIKQETGGVVRPRFEQHKLSKLNRNNKDSDFSELRYRSMSQGLGQVMGYHFKRVGAKSARDMYTSPVNEQIMFVARYLMPKKTTLKKRNPAEADFREIARFYNGSGYETHHYHESLEQWFRQFRDLIG